MDTEWEIK